MKKILCMIVALLLLFSMTGCARHYRSFRFVCNCIEFYDGEKLTTLYTSETNNDPSAEAEIPDAPEKQTVTIGGKKHELTLLTNTYSPMYGYGIENYKDKKNNLYVNYYSGTDKIWEIRQTGTDRAPVLTQLITMTDENSVIDSAKDIFAQLRGMETRYDEFTIKTELLDENGRLNTVNEFIKGENGQAARYELTFNLKTMDEIYATMQLWFNETGQITGYSAPDTSRAEKAWRGVTWDNEALKKQLTSLMEQTLKKCAERDGHEAALSFCSEKHEYSRTAFNYDLKIDENGKAYLLTWVLLVDNGVGLKGSPKVLFD